ncbi:hypothetical protein [Nocardioides marinisabuli]|uniref:hypothetical protein n=1 Tax=Nocardioides marinisabuli TaxID=419476 RepID=UPI0015DFD1BC|nr:hypothetical protein [Nocardioides marinisabuli]
MTHLTRFALLLVLALLLPATAYGAGLAQERWLGDDAVGRGPAVAADPHRSGPRPARRGRPGPSGSRWHPPRRRSSRRWCPGRR